MTVPVYEATVAAVLTSGSIALDVKRADVTLDRARAPFIQATVVAALGDLDQEAIDPRLHSRVVVTATTEWIAPSPATQTQTWDLLIHERTLDPEADRVTLTLVSDEAVLVDDGHLDDEALSLVSAGDSLADMIDPVLYTYVDSEALIDRADPNFVDGDFRKVSPSTNLVPNPKAANNTTGWVTSSTNSTIARVVVGSETRFRATAIGSGTAGIFLGSATTGTGAGIPCEAGKTYRAHLRWTGTLGRVRTVTMRFYNSAGAAVGSDTSGGSYDISDATLARVDGVAPAGAVKVAIFAFISSATAGNTLDVWDVRISELAEFDVGDVYFDGDTVDVPNPDANTDNYVFAWTGTANASTSTRTPTSDRDDSLLLVEPGTHWWEFFQPLAKARGLRLWCDGARTWHLTPLEATIAGTVTVEAGVDLMSIEDKISTRDQTAAGLPLYLTGVVVRYRWVDPDGVTQTRYDVAGTPGIIHRVNYSTPWPGTGAAQAILDVAQQRGRRQTPASVINIDAEPGMAFESLGVDGLVDQVGVVAAVTFRWDAESVSHGTMTIVPEGLADA